MSSSPLRNRIDHGYRRAKVWLIHRLGYRQSSKVLVDSAYQYWNRIAHTESAVNAHWRGKGLFRDDSVWLKLGRDHWDLFHRLADGLGNDFKPDGWWPRVVEWGCGGGMNAVHFGRAAERYFGVDISSETLQECQRQCEAEGVTSFRPILIHPDSPQDGLDAIGEPVDLFLTTYVFELLPTPEHGYELLKIAANVLRPKGLAYVQFRYDDGTILGRSRPWNYEKNLARNVTYSCADFERVSESLGFRVVGSELMPTIPELNETCYAYYLLARQ